MDEMIGGLTELGFPAVRVNFPRSYVDVNREPYELDPRMFSRPVAGIRQYAIDAGGRRPRHHSARGRRRPGNLSRAASVEEALGRIEALYKPYHAPFAALSRRRKRRSEWYGRLPFDAVGRCLRDEPQRPDVVIGDRYGTSCARLLADTVEETIRWLGYSVGRNKPYAGGFITEHYGNPASGLHTIQLELNRAIYMDERRRERVWVSRRWRLTSRAGRALAEIPLESGHSRPRRGNQDIPQPIPGRDEASSQEFVSASLSKIVRSRSPRAAEYDYESPQEKRATRKNKLPKSREETPKEGSDSARRYRTATICDCAAQSARIFDHFPCKIHRAGQRGKKVTILRFFQLFQIVT